MCRHGFEAAHVILNKRETKDKQEQLSSKVNLKVFIGDIFGVSSKKTQFIH